MKKYFSITLALILGATGCSYNEFETLREVAPEIVFTAVPFLDGDSESVTKTSVVPNETYSSYDFCWSAQDTVGIFPDAGSQAFFTMVNGEGVGTATFDGGAWTCKEGHSFRSYYPFIGNFYLDQTKIPVSFTGQKQIGNDNSDHFKEYDYMYTPVVTKGSEYLNFTYNHLITAILAWAEVPAGHYTKLTLSLDEPLFVTKGEYDLTSESPAIKAKQYSKTMSIDLDITFDYPDILKVYVPLAPINMTGKTLTVTITNDAEQFQYTYNPAKTYVASHIYRLRSPIVFESRNIVFSDAAVKAICVEHWDTDNDGELSYREACTVTTLGSKPNAVPGFFTFNEKITSFNELVFFRNLNTIDYAAFNGCKNLESITIPGNVTTIGEVSFCNCTSLAAIAFPESVTTIGADAFLNCPSLTSIFIPKTITDIGAGPVRNNPFSGCPNITSIVVDEQNPKYSSKDNCNAIIADGYSVGNTHYYTTLVSGCKTTIIPDNVEDIGYKAFSGCSSLTLIDIPASVKSISSNAFSGCTSLGSIVVNSVTPPSGSRRMFDDTNNCPIYVPLESVTAYKNSTAWTDYSSRIQGIPSE